ncbi:MAG: hypothetical protein CME70_07340 [Halobacteriovorax sp.]|nr:hypothetical protein [Halobacteriovorax sp.]
MVNEYIVVGLAVALLLLSNIVFKFTSPSSTPKFIKRNLRFTLLTFFMVISLFCLSLGVEKKLMILFSISILTLVIYGVISED